MEFPVPEAQLATFVAGTPVGAIPAIAITSARRQLFDTVGVAVAASTEPAGRALTSVIERLGAAPRATILGSSLRASVDQATWANGSLAHLLDFDDSGFSHPSACIAPAALSMGEDVDATLGQVLAAMVLGYEVFERIAAVGRFDDRRIRAAGVHPTPIYGSIAAAATASRLLGLGPAGTQTALSLAAAEGSGLTQHFGTWAKGLGAGAAARSGVVAALLASAGFFADPEAVSGRYGLMSALHGPGNVSFDDFSADLAERWSIVDPGLAIKIYPSCGVNRRAVDAILELRREIGFSPENIDEIVIHVQPDVFNTLRFRAPSDGFRGKFSLDYNVATAALDGAVTIESFTDERAGRPELRAMLARVQFVEHPEWPVERYRELPVEVAFLDGRRVERQVAGARGSRQAPLDDLEVRTKFVTCASQALGAQAAAEAAGAWMSSELETPIRELLAMTVPA